MRCNHELAVAYSYDLKSTSSDLLAGYNFEENS